MKKLKDKMKCPICSNDKCTLVEKNIADYTLSYVKRYYDIYQCESCALLFISPYPDEKDVKDFYPDNYGPWRPNREEGFGRHPIKKILKKILRGKMVDYLQGKKTLLGRLIWIFAYGIKDPVTDFVVKILRENRKDKLRVLDYGCGTGEKLKLIKKFFPRISEYGVDFSPGAIENARKNGINAEVADIDLLNETYTNHFDVVICSQVIEHIVDHKSFVRKMGNIISRRGHLIIATPNSDSILRKLFGKYWRAYEVPRHLVVFNELSIKKLFWGLGPDLKLACSKNYYVADGVVTIGSISNLLKNYAGLRIAKANYEIKYEFLLRQVAVTLNALSYVLGRSDQNIFLLHKVGS